MKEIKYSLPREVFKETENKGTAIAQELCGAVGIEYPLNALTEHLNWILKRASMRAALAERYLEEGGSIEEYRKKAKELLLIPSLED